MYTPIFYSPRTCIFWVLTQSLLDHLQHQWLTVQFSGHTWHNCDIIVTVFPDSRFLVCFCLIWMSIPADQLFPAPWWQQLCTQLTQTAARVRVSVWIFYVSVCCWSFSCCNDKIHTVCTMGYLNFYSTATVKVFTFLISCWGLYFEASFTYWWI